MQQEAIATEVSQSPNFVRSFKGKPFSPEPFPSTFILQIKYAIAYWPGGLCCWICCICSGVSSCSTWELALCRIVRSWVLWFSESSWMAPIPWPFCLPALNWPLCSGVRTVSICRRVWFWICSNWSCCSWLSSMRGHFAVFVELALELLSLGE